jgi:hypothetical protein
VRQKADGKYGKGHNSQKAQEGKTPILAAELGEIAALRVVPVIV